jgi:hypothetical protein
MKGNLSTPINKTAALVTSRSKHNYRFRDCRWDSELPLPHYASWYENIMSSQTKSGKPRSKKYYDKQWEQTKHLDLTGQRRGRLVAIGVSKVHKPKWVCRCDCGKYTIRQRRCFKRDMCFDACEECWRLEEHKTNGERRPNRATRKQEGKYDRFKEWHALRTKR